MQRFRKPQRPAHARRGDPDFKFADLSVVALAKSDVSTKADRKKEHTPTLADPGPAEANLFFISSALFP
jgi:hypothetical protein